MIEILDKIDKLPSGKRLEYVAWSGSRYRGYYANHLTTDELKTLSTHLRKLMQVDENARQIYNGEVDPRAEEE